MLLEGLSYCVKYDGVVTLRYFLRMKKKFKFAFLTTLVLNSSNCERLLIVHVNKTENDRSITNRSRIG